MLMRLQNKGSTFNVQKWQKEETKRKKLLVSLKDYRLDDERDHWNRMENTLGGASRSFYETSLMQSSARSSTSKKRATFRGVSDKRQTLTDYNTSAQNNSGYLNTKLISVTPGKSSSRRHLNPSKSPSQKNIRSKTVDTGAKRIKTINQNQLSKKHGYKPGIPLINSRIMNSKEEIRHEMVRPLPKSQGIGKRKQIPFTLPSMSQSIIEATQTDAGSQQQVPQNIDAIQDSIYSQLNNPKMIPKAPLEGMSRSYEPPYPKNMALLFKISYQLKERDEKTKLDLKFPLERNGQQLKDPY